MERLTDLRIVSHDTLDSTNAEALRLARAGESGPLWVTARRQTAGRGRRGRDWVSPDGNLYASLLLHDPAEPPRRSDLSLVAALALHDAILAIVPPLRSRLTLKWPNDALLDGRKLAGILGETEGDTVVIGIGVNCTSHPADAAYPATDLTAAGVPVVADRLLAALTGTMISRLTQWRRGEDFAAIRSDWLARADALGARLRVALPRGECEGRFETLDADGRLVLRLDDGRAEIVGAGDVHRARPATEMA